MGSGRCRRDGGGGGRAELLRARQTAYSLQLLLDERRGRPAGGWRKGRGVGGQYHKLEDETK